MDKIKFGLVILLISACGCPLLGYLVVEVVLK